MPSSSQAQANLMRAAAHDPAFAKKVGISQSTAREWSAEDSARGTKDLPKRATREKIAHKLRGQ